MLNIACIMGRLAADPELRHTQTQVPVTTFRVAVDRDYQPKDRQERVTDWIDVVAWRNTAEFVTKYFRKGSMIVVQGSIQTRSYTDRDGNKRTAVEISAEQVYFGERKRDDNAAPYQSQTPQFSEAPPAFSTAVSDDFEEILGDDDLPF